ncbi:MAG: hypothetical protein KAR44_06355 [Candidatus Aegiribacteria sp.]|nr:hypothetical protein [Candidatus Aegiribacteria sp.]
MDYFEWILVMFTCGMVNFFIALSSLKKFLALTSGIDSLLNLENLKEMVRKQMYQALLAIIFFGGMGVLGCIGIITGRLNSTQFVLFLVLNGIVWAAGKLTKPTELRAQNLTVSDPNLSDEYKSVCRTWIRRPFPDF